MTISKEKPTLLIISHVLPISGLSGQQQRVLQILLSARKYFRVVFLTVASQKGFSETENGLMALADEIIVLPSLYDRSLFTKAWHSAQASFYSWRTGLKKSNFVIGQVELAAQRLEKALGGRQFDCVLFEYWHAYKSASLFQSLGIPVVLDMVDILWKAFEQQVKTKAYPMFYKERIKRLYRQHEQDAWKSFDRIISINKIEQKMVKNIVSPDVIVDYLPMGIDLSMWNYIWNYTDHEPCRIGFYGGLSSKVNVKSALRCLDKIMPIIWEKKSDAEFWLIGNHPSDVLIRRAKTDPRIKITGYVENVQQVIAKMGAILCPWEGIFGFRSRIIEVMAVGVPLVVSADAIAGMGIAEHAIRIGQADAELADFTVEILENRQMAQQISLVARQDVEEKYSFESTYLDYFDNLAKSLEMG